jgi:putative intracellular protease/amidase
MSVEPTVAMLVDGGFEDSDLHVPFDELTAAGCKFLVVTDLVDAGAIWEDAEVVRDANLITSRRPSDLQAFCAAVKGALGVGA